MGKRDEILERSMDVFFKFSLNKISMDELSDQIGISKKTIYNHFGSKDNLTEEIVYHTMEKTLERVTKVLTDREKTIMEKVFLAVDNIYKQHVNFETPIKRDPNIARILYSPQCVKLTDEIINAVEDLALTAKEMKLLREDVNIDMFPYIFLNMIKGLATWERPDNVTFSKLELIRQSIETLLAGLLTPKALNEFFSKK